MVEISGKLVTIRDKRLDDAPDDYVWRKDEELAALDANRPISFPYQDFLRIYRDELAFPFSWSRRFGIDNLMGKHIGNCMYYDIDLSRNQTELGIMIGDRGYWSQGYGTEAVRLLVGYIFATMSIEKVYLHTLEWNVRARKSFQKAGFSEVKPVQRDGHDMILMDVLKADWKDNNATESDGVVNNE